MQETFNIFRIKITTKCKQAPMRKNNYRNEIKSKWSQTCLWNLLGLPHFVVTKCSRSELFHLYLDSKVGISEMHLRFIIGASVDSNRSLKYARYE